MIHNKDTITSVLNHIIKAHCKVRRVYTVEQTKTKHESELWRVLHETVFGRLRFFLFLSKQQKNDFKYTIFSNEQQWK